MPQRAHREKGLERRGHRPVRVSDAPAHPALTTPNLLGPDDYRGWVQERGLYFAATWDPRYQPLFSTNDAGDPPLEGAAIVARHGKGAFVYTGIAFFRQLPEGVPGAYRLMANLLALGAAKPGGSAKPDVPTQGTTPK